MGNKSCLIWGTLDSISYGPYGQVYDSVRTDGCYDVSANAAVLLPSLDEQHKARITTWLINQRRLGNKCPEITSKIIEETKQIQNLSVRIRSDRLLQFIHDQTPQIGREVSFLASDITCRAMALSESIDMSEVHFLLEYLERKNWLVKSESGFDKCVLAVEGYARIAELEQVNGKSSQAFVAMWFDETTTDAWEQGIKLGIRDAGYKPIRIDEKEHVNKIDDEIIAEIRRSHFVVADFTQGEDGARGGVYYEAGFAHGLNIPVIYLCRKDSLNKIHFDTRQYNHIVWDTPQELRNKLANRISAVLGDGPEK